ncbi:hypothetical protein TTHERM_00633420 (macronuclear) [Tetrahymena thermophila SB210]|uniref:Kinase domain protein n=1 Tax=Tetrahymena thermophila (strain SB210) TaxID=312017 RepID=Q22X11_TETTS|nr:hypothetical protein TTHERM_00633420 [Tetrahymena thermophila SB210]EAR89835.2 hypothetical protein TTHERM_00633420 [Tetrahymena thermophila SB210]|eukprot:XP_001010080.2 hypothetical protein TTHERM_00633420 [Tetrahymena thermophila SB210]
MEQRYYLEFQQSFAKKQKTQYISYFNQWLLLQVRFFIQNSNNLNCQQISYFNQSQNPQISSDQLSVLGINLANCFKLTDLNISFGFNWDGCEMTLVNFASHLSNSNISSLTFSLGLSNFPQINQILLPGLGQNFAKCKNLKILKVDFGGPSSENRGNRIVKNGAYLFFSSIANSNSLTTLKIDLKNNSIGCNSTDAYDFIQSLSQSNIKNLDLILQHNRLKSINQLPKSISKLKKLEVLNLVIGEYYEHYIDDDEVGRCYTNFYKTKNLVDFSFKSTCY